MYLTVRMDVEDEMRLAGRRLSLGSHGYAQMFDEGHVTLVHRWIMGCSVGDKRIVDHINHDVLDNRRENLRVVDGTQSNMNRRLQERDLPQGIYLTRSSRYQVKFKRYHQQYSVGTFGTIEEAIEARDAALARHAA